MCLGAEGSYRGAIPGALKEGPSRVGGVGTIWAFFLRQGYGPLEPLGPPGVAQMGESRETREYDP